MGRTPRDRPRRLPEKLQAIREHLGLTQTGLGKQMEVNPSRLSEFESGRREPNLIVLLRYSKAAKIHLEFIANDDLELPF